MSTTTSRASTAQRKEDLERIQEALTRGGAILTRYYGTEVGITYKTPTSPVTDADRAVDEALRRELPRAGEGWLSEESVDDRARLDRRRVWIVDPLDGTREFLDGNPQWTVSIGLAEDGDAVAGGVYNPSTEEPCSRTGGPCASVQASGSISRFACRS